jgi:hypothetical protein
MFRSRIRRSSDRTIRSFVALAAIALAGPAAGGGRLVATGGALPLEGSAGGGIVPWAVLSGTSTREEHGPTAAQTFVRSRDFALANTGFSYNFRNRVELGFARQTLDIGALTPALGFDPGDLGQDVFGVKVRLWGDAVYTTAPQIAAGVMHKRTREFLIPSAVGARDDRDEDYYVAMTKVFLGGALGRNGLVNLTLRSTRANQLGLLGFGGDAGNGRDVVVEFSAAAFANPHWAVGFEYREKPDNLGFAREDDWRDVFIAWFPGKHLSVVLARADLGSIAGLEDQTATYLSLSGSF